VDVSPGPPFIGVFAKGRPVIATGGSRLALVVALAVMSLAVSTGDIAAQEASPAAETGVWWDNAVCYEVFVRSFADSDGDGIGDLNGLTARLDYLNDGDPDSLLTFYRSMVHLRTSNLALSSGTFVTLDGRDRSVLAFLRCTNNESVLVIVNVGEEAVADLILDLDESPLTPGRYATVPMVGETAAGSLEIGTGGTIDNWMTGFELEPQTGSIFALSD